MGRFVVLAWTLAACGRVGFGADVEHRGDGAVAPDVPPACTGPDEDADGWPDACDNCAVTPNPTQEDRGEVEAGQSADGVGDACDPRPGVAGDRVAFAAFHDGSDPYTLYNTTSYTLDGALRLGTDASEGSASFEMPTTATRIEIAYTIVSSSAQLQWFGVWIHRQAPAAVFFEAAWDPDGPAVAVWRIKEQLANGDNYSADIVGPARFPIGTRYRITADTTLATGGAYRMRVTEETAGTTNELSHDVGLPPTAFGYLEAYRATIDFDYLVIYAAP